MSLPDFFPAKRPANDSCTRAPRVENGRMANPAVLCGVAAAAGPRNDVSTVEKTDIDRCSAETTPARAAVDRATARARGGIVNVAICGRLAGW